jgi:hypothetical protein
VRGKLLAIPNPKIVLITRGRVSRDFSSVESDDGCTTARPLAGRAPSPEYFASIRDALVRLAKETDAKVASTPRKRPARAVAGNVSGRR